MKQNLKTNGFTLIELLIVVIVLTTLFVMFMPARHQGASSTRITCTNNLKQVGLAFRIWAGDNNDRMPMAVSVTNRGAMEAVIAGNVATVFHVMSNELNTPKILFCPTDKKRIQAATFDQPASAKDERDGVSPFSNTNVTYFVGLDATDTLPSMFLSGDDNIQTNNVLVKPGTVSLRTNTPIAWSEARHEKQGNVGLADGSVQGFSSSALRAALRNTGVETNRLAMP
jgi:prepilin-type N-terminal cleavage/methylation domain-containing protein/prepilin-type processing-associated H-X9-DG protein